MSDPESIKNFLAVSVYGPDGPNTPDCADARQVASYLYNLISRVEALELSVRPRDNAKKCSESEEMPWAAAECLLNLQNRVKELEEFQLELTESHRPCVDAMVRRIEKLETNKVTKSPNHRGYLVQRLAKAIKGISGNGGLDWDNEAEVAIKVIADWLDGEDQGSVATPGTMAEWLREELDG